MHKIIRSLIILYTLFAVVYVPAREASDPQKGLETSFKYQNGQSWRNCVYGPSGVVRIWEGPGSSSVPQKDDPSVKCGSGWEGKGLYQSYIKDTRLDTWDENLWDLQFAYNCCVDTENPRSAICKSLHKVTVSTIPWNACGDYLDSLRGNVQGVDQITKQSEANDAVDSACILAIEKVRPEYKNFLTTFHGRLDKMYEVCKNADVLSEAIPNILDYLRDNTTCLWNNPFDEFCEGSRRTPKRPGGSTIPIPGTEWR